MEINFNMLFILIAIILLFYALKLLVNHVHVMYYLQKFPGPPTKHLIFGNIKDLVGEPVEAFKTLRKWSRDYYPNYKFWAGHYTVINIVNPYDCEKILADVTHNSKSIIYKYLENWLGTGLLTSTGKKWQQRRKMLTSAFHFNILQEFLPIINDCTMKLVEDLRKTCNQPYVNITNYITDFTLNSIAETSMGVNLKEKTAANTIYRRAVHNIGETILYRFLRPWFINDFIYFFTFNYRKEMKLVKKLQSFTRNVIEERKRNFKSASATNDNTNNNLDITSYSKKKRLAMLDLLLSVKDEQDLIDDEGIREEVDTFMFEGHDTTAAAICFALLLLANHKEAQDLIVQELKEVLGDIRRKPDYADLQEMKYLERCIKETLRLYPSVPFIARTIGEDMKTHNGYLIKKSSFAQLHIYDIHHNPEFYPDPEKFDPDRFLPENIQKRHPFAYVPFSAGPRNCIGQRYAMMELKVALCGILGNFILEPIDRPETIEMYLDLILRTKNGIKVKIIERKN